MLGSTGSSADGSSCICTALGINRIRGFTLILNCATSYLFYRELRWVMSCYVICSVLQFWHRYTIYIAMVAKILQAIKLQGDHINWQHLLLYSTKLHLNDFYAPPLPSSHTEIWYLVSNNPEICQRSSVVNKSFFRMNPNPESYL